MNYDKYSDAYWFNLQKEGYTPGHVKRFTKLPIKDRKKISTITNQFIGEHPALSVGMVAEVIGVGYHKLRTITAPQYRMKQD